MLTIYSKSLTANTDERTITGVLLPYGEQGATSAGRVTATAASITVPEDVSVVTLNIEHDGLRPVGRATAIESKDDGLHATFRVARTTAGNDLLEEVAEGLRASLSVEVDAPVIRDGVLIAGSLMAAGAVVSPAFPSASIYALTAADAGEIADALTELADELRNLDSQEPPADDQTDADASDISNEEEHQMSATDNAAVPTDLLASAAKNNNPAKDESLSLASVEKMVAHATKTGDDSSLKASLQNITVGSVYDDISQPQFLGELWSGRSFAQAFAPLVSHQDLKSRKAVGWRWLDEPTVDDYAGFPNEVPSDTIDTELVSVNAQRLAGGWKLDREFYDFGETEFIDTFFRKATDDYSRKIDAKVLSYVVANSTSVTGGAAVAGIAPGTVKIVDGALYLLGQNVTPTFAIVGSDLYRAMVLSPKDNALEFLTQAAGLENGSLSGITIIPSSNASVLGKVFVGAKEAVTLFELPGSPIRLNALDVAHNGSDEAIIGYFALLYTGKGLVKVS